MHIHETTGVAGSVAAVIGSLLVSPAAFGWLFQNTTSESIQVTLISTGNGELSLGTLGPGQTMECPLNDFFGCPAGVGFSPTDEVQIRLRTPGYAFLDVISIDRADWEISFAMEAGGSAYIVEEQRPAAWNTRANLFVEVHAADGAYQERVPTGLAANARSVHFLASADCQFHGGNGGDIPDPVSLATNQKMIEQWEGDATIRGIVYAGDLTQNNDVDERAEYLASLRRPWLLNPIIPLDRQHLFFDGLGNHDYGNDDAMFTNVAERHHATCKSHAQYLRPHYSWDWHDVHFVQLNLMPANDIAPERPFDPNGALDFLIADLAAHVGDSGRPVVTIHHYGFDGFSMNDENGIWWTEAQRDAYMDAIQNYNVVLMLSGHLHPDDTEGSWRDAQHSGGQGPIVPNVTVGAATAGADTPGYPWEGIYTELEMNGANQIRVAFRDAVGGSGTVLWFDLKTPVWVDPGAAVSGRGWKDDPFATIGQAIASMSGTFTEQPWAFRPIVPLKIAPGTYSETGTFDARFTIDASDGPVTIGN